MKTRTWLWIALGAITVLTVGCFALVGTGIYFVSRQMDFSQADQPSAERAFADVRARFANQTPLFESGEKGTVAAALEKRIAEYSGPLPKELHVLAWDDREERLVRMRLPFWLLRLGGSHSLDIDGFDLRQLDLTAEDLERAGPALLVDRSERGSRVLVWTE